VTSHGLDVAAGTLALVTAVALVLVVEGVLPALAVVLGLGFALLVARGR
jgi:hypothetical protein